MRMEQTTYTKTAAVLLIVVLTGFLLIYLKAILFPITLSVFFSFLLLPMVQQLERRRVARWLAIVIGLVLVVTVMVGLFMFFGSQVVSLVGEMPTIKAQLVGKLDDLQHYIETVTRVSIESQNNWIATRVIEMADSATGVAVSIFSATGTALAMMGLVPILAFFMLLHRDRFRHFIHMVGGEHGDHAVDVVRAVSAVSQKYLKGLTIDVFILCILNSVGLSILGIPYAILLGSLAGVLNIIPYVGVMIGSLMPVLMALLTKDSLWYAVGAWGVCSFVQFLDNNFITPKIVGSSVSINPLAATFALLFGGMIWGIQGMVLSIPVVGMMKVALDNIEQLKPFGYLLGEQYNYDTSEKEGSGSARRLMDILRRISVSRTGGGKK